MGSFQKHHQQSYYTSGVDSTKSKDRPLVYRQRELKRKIKDEQLSDTGYIGHKMQNEDKQKQKNK